MDKITIKLIKLYATRRREELENENAGSIFVRELGMPPLELLKDESFRKNKELISSLKKVLEDLEKDAVNEKDLMSKCLDYVFRESFINNYNSTILKQRMEVLYLLIIETFKKKWSDPQRNFFKEIFTIFTEYHLYFLSYTNHFPYAINNTYKEIYKYILNPYEIKEEDYFKKNFLARAFTDRLKVRNLKKGFYDDYSIRYGDNIPNSVSEDVKKSLAFIQLISSATLEANDPNWPYSEFDTYYNTRTKYHLMLFFITEANAIPNEDVIPDNYRNWIIQIIPETKHFKLYEVKSGEEFFQIIDKLINRIILFKNEIITSIPN